MDFCEQAEKSVKSMWEGAFLPVLRKEKPNIVVIYDEKSELARILTAAYKEVLPEARAIQFAGEDSAPDILQEVNQLEGGDLVVLVQTTSFRLNDFRFRIELFKKGLAVIEHPHLGRIPENEMSTFLESLFYDATFYRTMGPALKARIDVAKIIEVVTPAGILKYDGPFEDAKLNTGEYAGMKNIGGQFPIGEVFTEPKMMENVSGEVQIFAFGDMDFTVSAPEVKPILRIEKGEIVEVRHSNPAFDRVLEQIRQDEDLCIRELGFGLNRALTKTRMLRDVGAYERMCGVHVSLGMKHAMYTKPGISKRKTKYHVDVFVDVEEVRIDGDTVYRNGSWL